MNNKHLLGLSHPLWALIVATFSLSGCGGGGDEQKSGVSTPTTSGVGSSANSSGASSVSSSTSTSSVASSMSSSMSSGSSGSMSSAASSSSNGLTALSVNVCAAPKPASLSSAFAKQAPGSSTCANCHGGDGSSGFGAKLSMLDFKNRVSLASFQSTVRFGVGNMKASFNEAIYPDSALINDYAYFAHGSLCSGGGSSSSASSSSSSAVATASCSVSKDLLTAKLRRLTKVQFANTVKTAFPGSYADSLWPEFGDIYPSEGMIKSEDMRLQDLNLQASYNSVDSIVTQLVAQDTTVKACIAATGTTCMTALIDTQGKILWRRPATTAEKNKISGSITAVSNAGGNRTQQVSFVLKALMLHPNFMFRSELGALQNGAIQLNAYEIASLLSYSLWDSPPDATLFAAAADNSLLQQSTIETQVVRMLADAKFDQTLVGFYRDYLQLDLVKTAPKLSEFNFTSAQRSALLTSANLTLTEQVANKDKDISAVFAANQFYVNSDIAALFGVSASGSNQQKITMPSGQRNTLLSHPAFLSGHAKESGSGIVKRGVYTLRQLLCIDLGDPPAAAMEKPIPPSIDAANTSTRNILTLTHTSDPCASCHVAIDPAGFGYENYDTLGRYRTTEKNNVPIDASGTLSVGQGELLTFSNSVEFTNALVNSPSMRACVSKRFLENITGEKMTPASCELNKFTAQLNSNQTSIRQLATALAKLESMRLRK
jgi:hypothetical protein